jgi:hypothetical protein
MHWGPGYSSAFIFNQASAPYHHAHYQLQLGSFIIESAYGALLMDGMRSFTKLPNTRVFYGRRYTWTPSPTFKAGISENLIMADQKNAFAFFPFFPYLWKKD